MQISEKYRPSKWSEVIGQDKVVSRLKTLIQSGTVGGKAYLFTGKSGTGKTTIARLLAGEIADEMAFKDINVGYPDCAPLKKIEQAWETKTFGKGGAAYFLNEPDGLSEVEARYLLKMLENIPKHVVVIFTSIAESSKIVFENKMDSAPLFSRCLCFSLAQRDLAEPFALRAKEIAEIEGLAKDLPLKRYIKLVNDNKSNLRAVLNALVSGELLP